jgi:hypothetical protein
MPALPGEQYKVSHFGFCFTAHASECSRPPEPKISIFMFLISLAFSYNGSIV